MYLLSGLDIVIVVTILYLTIGLYSARATTVLVNGGLMWQESTLWQKFQRMVLFPVQTLGAFLHPHPISTPLARLQPSYELLAQKNPTFYCIFLWPLTVILFAGLVIALALSAVWALLSWPFHRR
tara:strand:+ start:636 stop:1010 length:375 start_codon:yes stop_codon:yes gene_type:complete